jgi:hypothetical protein
MPMTGFGDENKLGFISGRVAAKTGARKDKFKTRARFLTDRCYGQRSWFALFSGVIPALGDNIAFFYALDADFQTWI